jgi:DNA-binding response OmpR family regulator
MTSTPTRNIRRRRSALGNVLVVEDDIDTADTIAVSLLEEGFGVRKATSRDEALKILPRYIYDWVILDLMMPGATAEEFLAELRSKSPRTSVVLITAGERVKDAAEALGVTNYLGKPFHPDDLVNLLRSADQR